MGVASTPLSLPSMYSTKRVTHVPTPVPRWKTSIHATPTKSALFAPEARGAVRHFVRKVAEKRKPACSAHKTIYEVPVHKPSTAEVRVVLQGAEK